MESVLNEIQLLCGKVSRLGVERLYIYIYILFTSGCVTRSDRHGHLKDTSEENSRRKVSQDLCNVEVILKLKYTVVPSVQ